jgi:hypothetical protein
MYLVSPAQKTAAVLPVSASAIVLLAVLAVPTFVLGFAFSPLLDLARESVRFFAGI